MKQQKNGIFSKWLIKGFSGFCFGSDKKLYKLPYESNKRYISLREIKKQYPNRYKLNGKWRSEKQLQGLIYLNQNPQIIIKGEEMPF